jgi:hypothetical protein
VTLVLTLASCETGTPDETTSLISTTVTPVTTAPAPETTAHVHSYTPVVTAPTCTEKGYTTYTCACGDKYVDNYTDALGHSFGEWVTTKAATCTATGTETRTCTRCNATETRDIAISAHQYVETVTAPTKTAPGYTTHTCAVCGKSFVDSHTNPTGSTGLAYETNADGSITITGYGTCTDEDVIIYSTYYVVDSTGKSVTKLVTGIATGAFMNNATIKTISIPASVTTIGNGAFAGCTKLTAFTVESDNKNFSTTGGMLMSKDGATIVAYPAGLTLDTFTISNSITAINPSAFAGCVNIVKFAVTTDHKKFVVVDDVLYDVDKKLLIAYPCGKSLASFVVPTTVETIGDYAFFNAKKLNAVSFPDRTYAADGVTISIPGIASIGSFAFYGCTEFTIVTIPNITETLGAYAFANCTKLANVIYGSALKAISAHCFEGDTAFVNVTIPSTIVTIGQYAFANCTGIINVVISSGVKTISDYAFNNCTAMTTLVIGKDVTAIGYKAFTGCLNKGKDAGGNNIARVYYEGSSGTWNGATMTIDSSNSMYLTIYADIYFYSETNPGSGHYWHYVGSTPTAY